MDPLLITTRVDLSGANELAAGVTSAMAQVRTATTTASTSMLEFKSSTNGAAAAAAELGESGAGVAPLAESMAALTAAVTKLSTAIDTIPVHSQKAAVESEGAFATLEKRIVGTAEAAQVSATGIGSAFGGLSALLGGGILVGFLARFVDQAKDATLEISHLAERTGLSVQTVAGLEIEMERLGLGLEAASTGMIRLERATNLALQGHAAQAKAFHDLGISMKELQSLSPEDVLNRVSGAMQNQTSQFVKANAAITLFGRGGAALIPIFNQYGASLSEVAGKLGEESGETERAVDLSFQWQEAQTNLSVALRRLALEALPALTNGLNLATQAAALWRAESDSAAEGTKKQGGLIAEFRRELALTTESYGYLTIKAEQYLADLRAFNEIPTTGFKAALQAMKDNAALADLQIKDLKKDTEDALNPPPPKPIPPPVPPPTGGGRYAPTAGAPGLTGARATEGEEGADDAAAAEAEAREEAKFEHLKEFAEATAARKAQAAHEDYEHNRITSEQEVQQLKDAEEQKNRIILAGLQAQKTNLTATLGDYAPAEKLSAINSQIEALTQQGATATAKIEEEGNKQTLKQYIDTQNNRIAALKSINTLSVEEAANNAAKIVDIAQETADHLSAIGAKGGTVGTREQVDAANKAVLEAVRSFNEAIQRENRAAAAEETAELEAQTKARLKILEDGATRELADIATQTKKRQAAQAETYKAETARPFAAPVTREAKAQDNADKLVAIARSSSAEQVAIVQDAAIKEAQAVEAQIPVFKKQFDEGYISAEEYGKKVAAIQEQITTIAQTAATKRVQITDAEANEETKIQEQLLATYEQIKTQELAAITGLVTSATSSLNSFAVTIATTVGEVNGKISETRYIGEQFSKLWIQIEREFLQMILRMLEETTLFKGLQKGIESAFKDAFGIIPGLFPKNAPTIPPPTFGPIPGQGGVATVAENQAAISGGGVSAQQTAANAALTEFTSALHTATGALTQGHAAAAADVSATQTSTAATTADVTATRAGTLATSTDTAATHASTVATTTDTGATHAATAAQTISTSATHNDTAATLVSTTATHTQTAASAAAVGAQTANTTATAAGAAAHTADVTATTVDTGAHTAHAAAVFVSLGSFVAHEAAVIADTIALIVHEIASLFTGQTGGLIQGPGSGTSDSIPMMVSHGEYIVKAATVDQPGMLPMLHAINAGRISPEQIAGGGAGKVHAALGGLAELASPFARYAEGGEAGGDRGDTNISTTGDSSLAFHYHAGNISALDASGMSEALGRNHGEIKKTIRTLVNRGAISPRDILRHR